jgi:hypothetical protein
MKRRLAATGLALVTTLGLGACQTGGGAGAGPAASGATAAAHDPAAAKELVAAAEKLAQDTVKVDMTMGGGVTMAGVMDPKGGRARMTMRMADGGGNSEIRTVKVGDDMYMRFSSGLADVVGGKWVHIDVAALKAGSNFAIMPQDDPTGARSLAGAVTEVSRQNGGYAGVLDVTKAPSLNKDSLNALGATATTVPFTATVDGDGRLTSMKVDMTGLAPTAGTMTTTYSGFGTPVKVTAPPAAEVTEPPKELAGLLNA